MSKRWTTQAILALFLMVLGFFAYWLENSHKPNKEEAENAGKKLFNLDNQQIDTIRIVDGSRVFSFKCLDQETKECKPGAQPRWEMVEPQKASGDKTNINSLVSSLNNTNASDTIDLSQETPEKRNTLLATEYGLGPDQIKNPEFRRVEVILAGEGSPRLTAFFGGTHPVGDKIFVVSENSSKVLLVPSYFKSNFDHDVTYWRDKRLFSISGGDVTTFDYQGPGLSLSASKAEGSWALKIRGKTGSEEYPGDIENVDSWLRSVVFLNAKNFVSEKKDSATAKRILGSAHQVLQFTFQTEKKESILFRLFETKKDGKIDKLFATVSNFDPLVEVETSVKERLQKNLKDLRLARLITSLERFTAKKLVISGKQIGEPPVSLVNSDSKWNLEESKAIEVPQGKISKILDKLSGKHIIEFLDASKVPAPGPNAIQVQVTGDTPESARSFQIWTEAEKGYARNLKSKRNEVFVLEKSFKDAMPWDRKFFTTPDETTKSSLPVTGGEGDLGDSHEGHDH